MIESIVLPVGIFLFGALGFLKIVAEEMVATSDQPESLSENLVLLQKTILERSFVRFHKKFST